MGRFETISMSREFEGPININLTFNQVMVPNRQ